MFTFCLILGVCVVLHVYMILKLKGVLAHQIPKIVLTGVLTTQLTILNKETGKIKLF